MDKYQVLLTLIVWYICCGVATAVFQPGTHALTDTGLDPSGVNSDTWTVVSFFIGGLWFGFNVPECPPVLSLILTLPFYALMIYFIYLNLPTVTVLGTSVKPPEN